MCWLSEKFPSFRLSSDEFTNESFSFEDNVSILSLLLYYSCVLRVSQYFQDCSKSLNAEDQKIVFTFFEIIKQAQEFNNEPITKDVIIRAVQKAAPPSPRYRIFSSSPIRTPDKGAVNPTPSKLPHEKLMELKFTRTQLEHERFEKNLLETEVKDYEDKIHRLRKFEISFVAVNFNENKFHPQRKKITL